MVRYYLKLRWPLLKNFIAPTLYDPHIKEKDVLANIKAIIKMPLDQPASKFPKNIYEKVKEIYEKVNGHGAENGEAKRLIDEITSKKKMYGMILKNRFKAYNRMRGYVATENSADIITETGESSGVLILGSGHIKEVTDSANKNDYSIIVNSPKGIAHKLKHTLGIKHKN